MRRRDRPKLYPNHQHQWVGVHARDCALNAEGVVSRLNTNFTPPPRCDCTPQAQCTVCDLEMPRNVIEAYSAERADTDTPTYRVGVHEFTDPEYARMEEYAQGIGLGAYRPPKPDKAPGD